MALVVVGGALANPNGFGNLSPQISTLTSTLSIAVKNLGSCGSAGTETLCNDCKETEGKEVSFLGTQISDDNALSLYFFDDGHITVVKSVISERALFCEREKPSVIWIMNAQST